MPRCGGRGVCGCGSDACAENAWWFAWGGVWLLIAYDKPLLAKAVVPGLSLGILLGALVIVASWLLTWIYVRWANTSYDHALRDLG